MQKQKRDPAMRWNNAANGVLCILGLLLLCFAVFFFTGNTIWDIPLFFLISGILLAAALVFYLLCRSRGVKVWKTRLIFGLVVLLFLVLMLMSVLSVAMVLGTI